MLVLNERVYAASSVITITANGNTQGATVSGTTDDDVVAVLIEILDERGGIITLETHAVTNGSYKATLSCTLTEGKTYTAYVVNYNGTGTPQSTSFTVNISSDADNGENNGNSNNNNSNNNSGNDSNNSNTSNNPSDSGNNQAEHTYPKTGDENKVLLWVLLLIGFSAAVTCTEIMKIIKKSR